MSTVRLGSMGLRDEADSLLGKRTIGHVGHAIGWTAGLSALCGR